MNKKSLTFFLILFIQAWFSSAFAATITWWNYTGQDIAIWNSIGESYIINANRYFTIQHGVPSQVFVGLIGVGASTIKPDFKHNYEVANGGTVTLALDESRVARKISLLPLHFKEDVISNVYLILDNAQKQEQRKEMNWPWDTSLFSVDK